MALPDAGDPVPASPNAEMEAFIDGAGVASWGQTKAPYVANLMGSFPEANGVRQRFNANVSLRQQEATARVLQYTPLISDEFPEPTYKSTMTQRTAERIVRHVLGQPIDYLGSDYVTYAVQQLGMGHELYTRWKAEVTRCIAGETEIRDTAIAYINSLPVSP